MALEYLRSGNLDRSITLQSRTTTIGPYGDSVVTWTDIATVWAEKRPVSGRETLIADQIAALNLIRFRIRHRTDVDATCRIVFENKNYDIRYIEEIGRRLGLDIHAEVVNP